MRQACDRSSASSNPPNTFTNGRFFWEPFLRASLSKGRVSISPTTAGTRTERVVPRPKAPRPKALKAARSRRHRAATTRASGVYVRGLLSADVVDLLSPNAERLVPLVTRLAVDAQLPLVPRTRSERQRRKDARKRSQQASSRRMTRRSPDLKLRLDMHRPIGHLDRVTVRSHEGRARSSASIPLRVPTV